MTYTYGQPTRPGTHPGPRPGPGCLRRIRFSGWPPEGHPDTLVK
jgi:hypothetical protein